MTVNMAMWRKALTAMPHMERSEWDRLDIVAKWLVSTRAAALVITIIPCLIVALLAIRAGRFDPTLWAITTFGLVMAHATNNLLNDMTDYLTGVDKNNYFRTQYGVQPIEAGLMSVRQNLAYAAATGLVALACGAYLVETRGGPTIWLVSVGAFFVLFYTWPLKHIGMGEIAVFLVWGPLMIAGAYFVVTGEWGWRILSASLPYGLGAGSVIFGKHIDKYEADKAKGIHTLPVLLGEKMSRYCTIGIMAAQYIFVVALVITGSFGLSLLLVFLALPSFGRALQAYKRPRPIWPPANYPASAWPLWHVSFSFVHNRTFGFWFLVGLSVDVILHRFPL